MRTRGTLQALRAAAAAVELTDDERTALRTALEPVLQDAAHGLRVAADALDGPDPEAAAMFLHDTLQTLERALTRAAPRLPI